MEFDNVLPITPIAWRARKTVIVPLDFEKEWSRLNRECISVCVQTCLGLYVLIHMAIKLYCKLPTKTQWNLPRLYGAFCGIYLRTQLWSAEGCPTEVDLLSGTTECLHYEGGLGLLGNHVSKHTTRPRQILIFSININNIPRRINYSNKGFVVIGRCLGTCWKQKNEHTYRETRFHFYIYM